MAGLQIVIPGADFSGSGIPRNIRYIPGTEIPAAGALGLWALDEGSPDSLYDGDFANRVPGSGPARVLSGWSPPRRRSFGMEVESPNGTLIDTGISAKRSQFTQALVYRAAANPGVPDPYLLALMLSSDTDMGLPADNSGNFNLNSFPGIRWGVGVTLNSHRSGELIAMNSTLSSTGSTSVLPSGMAAHSQWIAAALSIDGEAGTVRIQTLTGSWSTSDAERGNTLIRDYFVTNLESRNGNHLFGIAPNSTGRAGAGPIGGVCCGAIHGYAMAPDEIDSVLRGLAKIGVDRGVTVAGY